MYARIQLVNVYEPLTQARPLCRVRDSISLTAQYRLARAFSHGCFHRVKSRDGAQSPLFSNKAGIVELARCNKKTGIAASNMSTTVLSNG